MTEPNPDWVDAPYEESFLFFFRASRSGWNRRRRIRARRLAVRQANRIREGIVKYVNENRPNRTP